MIRESHLHKAGFLFCCKWIQGGGYRGLPARRWYWGDQCGGSSEGKRDPRNTAQIKAKATEAGRRRGPEGSREHGGQWEKPGLGPAVPAPRSSLQGMERWLVLSVTCTHAVIRTRSRTPGQKDSNASSSWTRADLGKGAGKRNVLVLQDHRQSGSLGLHLPSVRSGGRAPLAPDMARESQRGHDSAPERVPNV